MHIIKPNWYGFDHDKVSKQFECDLSFVNDFCVNGEYQPSAVYRAKEPNKTKGHKKYFLLTKTDNGFVVRGMSPQKMEQFRYQNAIHCMSCDSVVYSINRHDYRGCECDKVSIDGGKEYTHISFSKDALYRMVTLDLLTDEISEPKKP